MRGNHSISDMLVLAGFAAVMVCIPAYLFSVPAGKILVIFGGVLLFSGAVFSVVERKRHEKY